MTKNKDNNTNITYAILLAIFSVSISALSPFILLFPIVSLIAAALSITSACIFTKKTSTASLIFILLGALSYIFALLLSKDIFDSLFAIVYIIPALVVFHCINKNKLRTSAIVISSIVMGLCSLALVFFWIYRNFGMPDFDLIDKIYAYSLNYVNDYISILNQNSTATDQIELLSHSDIKLVIDSLIVSIPAYIATFLLVWSYAVTGIHRRLANSVGLQNTDYAIWLPTMSTTSAYIYLAFSFLYFLTGFSEETLSLFVVFVNNTVSILTPGFLIIGLRILKRSIKSGVISSRFIIICGAITIFSGAISPYTIPYTFSSLLNILAVWGALGTVFSKFIKKIITK